LGKAKKTKKIQHSKLGVIGTNTRYVMQGQLK